MISIAARVRASTWWTSRRALPVAVVVAIVTGCGDSTAPAPPFVASDSLGTLTVTGDPAGVGGASWTFKGTTSGVAYDLTGVLYKPPGSGPFPAVVLSTANATSPTINIDKTRWWETPAVVRVKV
jgi:hypothetical protein